MSFGKLLIPTVTYCHFRWDHLHEYKMSSLGVIS
jgi:hypothetical protein